MTDANTTSPEDFARSLFALMVEDLFLPGGETSRIIVGGRGWGKTSLLKAFHDRALGLGADCCWVTPAHLRKWSQRGRLREELEANGLIVGFTGRMQPLNPAWEELKFIAVDNVDRVLDPPDPKDFSGESVMIAEQWLEDIILAAGERRALVVLTSSHPAAELLPHSADLSALLEGVPEIALSSIDWLPVVEAIVRDKIWKNDFDPDEHFPVIRSLVEAAGNHPALINLALSALKRHDPSVFKGKIQTAIVSAIEAEGIRMVDASIDLLFRHALGTPAIAEADDRRRRRHIIANEAQKQLYEIIRSEDSVRVPSESTLYLAELGLLTRTGDGYGLPEGIVRQRIRRRLLEGRLQVIPDPNSPEERGHVIGVNAKGDHERIPFSGGRWRVLFALLNAEEPLSPREVADRSRSRSKRAPRITAQDAIAKIEKRIRDTLEVEGVDLIRFDPDRDGYLLILD